MISAATAGAILSSDEGQKAVKELSFVLTPATGKVVIKNCTNSDLNLKTYDERDSIQFIPYANYTVAPSAEIYIQARGDNFIHCWVVNNGTMYTPAQDTRNAWNGTTLTPE